MRRQESQKMTLGQYHYGRTKRAFETQASAQIPKEIRNACAQSGHEPIPVHQLDTAGLKCPQPVLKIAVLALEIKSGGGGSERGLPHL